MSVEPEWTERADKRGLDPLGMQNAGVSLYQSLLPGISNVTLRMRYYGFYCWVSDTYARSGATDEFLAWRSWVRRAEALYALVCAHLQGEGGVGGIEWANGRLNLEEPLIDFAEAASNEQGAMKYLRQSLGVFGGAYYSQMAEMGLFRAGDHGIQRATNVTGRRAADAFRDSIGARVESILVKAISLASVTRSDLDFLAPIAPSKIPPKSLENETYRDLLLAKVEPTIGDLSRSASLRLILKSAEFLGRRPDADSIRWHLFTSETFGDERLDAQRVRWEAYQCQDLFQIAAAALLEWSIDIIAENDAGRQLVEIRTEVVSRLAASEPNSSALRWRELRQRTDPAAFDYQGVMMRLTGRRGIVEEKAWDAVKLMAALDHRISDRLDLKAVAGQELRVEGGARSITSELGWIGRRKELSAGELISAYVVERVIQRHSWVAMQKLRRQRDYTFLFEIHDGRLVRRNGYAPVPTTPRLLPAVQFLFDVGLIDAKGITERGRAALGEDA